MFLQLDVLFYTKEQIGDVLVGFQRYELGYSLEVTLVDENFFEEQPDFVKGPSCAFTAT